MPRQPKSLRVYGKAEAALISAIEIYNKPNFAYREETFAILAINAWELLLKAKVLADNDNKLRSLYIYEQRTKRDGTRTARTYPKRNRAGNPYTIGMSGAIAILERNAKTRLPTEVRGNLAAQKATTTSSSGYHIALDLNISFKRSATDTISTFALTTDPSAPHVYLTEEDIRAKYPWDYGELVKRCRARYSDFKENEEFHQIRRPLLEDSRYARLRFLDPGNPKSSKKQFHNPTSSGNSTSTSPRRSR